MQTHGWKHTHWKSSKMATDTDAQDPKMSNPNTTQIGGTHYTDKAIQPWDAMQAWMSPEAFEGFLLGSAIAYLARYHTVDVSGKGGLQDVLKARHYLDKLIATIEAQRPVKAAAMASVGDANEWTDVQ